MTWSERLRNWAKQIKLQATTVYFAARDSRMPLHVKLLALLVVAYAFSPIDLIPDFIPVLGYLDDLLLVPLGLLTVIRLTPPEVLQSAHEEAKKLVAKPTSYLGAMIILLVWLTAILGTGLLVTRCWMRSR